MREGRVHRGAAPRQRSRRIGDMSKRAEEYRGETEALSGEDRQVWDLLEEARLQYERYRELRDTTAVLSVQEPPTPPVPDWHTPLTLVLRS